MEDLMTSTGSETTGSDSFSLGDVDSMLAGDQTESSQEATASDGEQTRTEESQEVAGEEPSAEPTFDGAIKPQIVDGPNGSKLHQYSAADSAQLQSFAQFANDLQAAIPDLTVEDAVAHNEAYTDLTKLVHDIKTGTPEAAIRFGNMILNEAGNGPFVANLTNALVDYAQRSQPQVFEAIKGKVESSIGEELYDLARRTASHPDKTIREGYRMLAELFHYHTHNGETRPVAEALAVDPLAERERSIKAREAAIANESRAREVQQANAWTAAVKTQVSSDLQKELDQQLEPHLKKYEKDPVLIRALKRDVTAQLKELLGKDREWSSRFDIQWSQAHSERNRQSAERIAGLYLARAKSILKSQLPRMLTSASNGVVAGSKARHQQLSSATGPSHRVPGASGAPAKQSIARSPSKFKTPDEYAAELDSLVTQ